MQNIKKTKNQIVIYQTKEEGLTRESTSSKVELVQNELGRMIKRKDGFIRLYT